jgi:HSP20 family molecular chaperone IbpA
MLHSVAHDSSHPLHSGQMSIHEDSNVFMVSLDFSPFEKTSLNIWLIDRLLTLMAGRRAQAPLEGADSSVLFRCIDLPSTVAEDSIQAELTDTRLDIRFKKRRASCNM